MSFTKPKISKQGNRYFITFTVDNLKTGGRKHIRTSGGANRIKNSQERHRYLSEYRNEIESMLIEGWNPTDPKNKFLKQSTTIESEIIHQLREYKNRLSPKTFIVYKSTLIKFLDFLKSKHYNTLSPNDINRKIIYEFHQHSAGKNISNRTANNRLRVIKSLFTYIIKRDLIDTNPAQNIDLLPEISGKHKVYTPQEAKEIAEYTKQNNPRLYLMINFIMYCFVRPETACRLKIEDFDLNKNLLKINPHNTNKQRSQTKILLPQIIQLIKPYIYGQNPKHHLFATQFGGVNVSPASEKGNRDWYSRKFKVVKEKLNLHPDHTLYGFRHTAASDLYINLRKRYTKDEAEAKLMHITGHETKTALRKYLKNIGADVPEDYSELYSFSI